MEISSLTMSLSSSFPRPSSSLPLSSSHSLFFAASTASPNFLKSQISIRAKSERRRKGLSCNALFGLGVPELVVIAGVVVLVFGPKKLPEVGKSIGKTVKSFQQAAKEFESELKKEPEDSMGETPEAKSTAMNEEGEKQEKVSSSKESV